MLLFDVKITFKSQAQEDFYCNEDALFNVFFRLSFAVCSHGVMNLRVIYAIIMSHSRLWQTSKFQILLFY